MIQDIEDGEGVISAARLGAKGASLCLMARQGLPVPDGFVLTREMLDKWLRAGGPTEEIRAVIDAALSRMGARIGRVFGDSDRPMLLSVRPSAEVIAPGLAAAILNLGATEAAVDGVAVRFGARTALDIYRRFIQGYACSALGADAEEFEHALYDRLKYRGVEGETELDAKDLRALCDQFRDIAEEAADAPLEGDAREQLDNAIGALARSWGSPTARILRRAKGVSDDAGFAVVVQRMVFGLLDGRSGAGVATPRETTSGAPCLTGAFLPDAQGEEALMGLRTPRRLTRVDREAQGLREPSLEEIAPEAADALGRAIRVIERKLGDAYQVEFTVEAGDLWLLEAKPMRRNARAAVRIAVDLAEAGAISREDALLRIDARLLDEHLHPTVDPGARRDVIARGLPASPGAATGALVFSPDAVESLAARGERAILARIETSPEDIRGMHAAVGVLTTRGGMTSHAAVVARGLGAPCVVGASDARLDLAGKTLRAADGRVLREGDMLTVDGSVGEALVGAVRMVQPELTGAFGVLMDWADAARRLRVRANADTPHDARVARSFAVDGIGLCRTEHMFFDRDRITDMREMILADDQQARSTALSKLLPMQRGDFVALFRIMRGLPVMIRLLDPPLHEFLPHSGRELRELAESMDQSIDKIKARAEDLQEFNPMLGKRGCRLGIVYPEIYRMQARAIFEASIEAAEETGESVEVEIMIPLISTARELELIKLDIDAVAQAVQGEQGRELRYQIGAMVETPRAALRAGAIAMTAQFLSFGTNDLTQMTYGMSRDDAGRFMREYVAKRVLPEDPFHSLDIEGVGELIVMAIERARTARSGISLGVCGEHGGDPSSIRFCELAGVDYVSCSPYRAPIARLAAAQAAVMLGRQAGAPDPLSLAVAP